MTDTFTPEKRRAIMRAVRAKDTAPERLVRSLLHRAGFRFRLHVAELPGKPDIALPRYKVAIFVHGCFWHAHPDPRCRRARIPKTRTGYWTEKLGRNVERDQVHVAGLEALGWRTLVVWECELRAADLLERLSDFIVGSARN